MNWKRWRTEYTTEAGDDLILEYSDATLGETSFEPAEYYICYHKLTVNDETVPFGSIEDYLSRTLDDWETIKFFEHAEFDPDD